VSKKLFKLDEKLIRFIEDQNLFFTGTAGVDGRVNISPKGMDTLRVINPEKIVWLNLTGSGNETAAHVLECNRMTIMFCAFEGKPQTLRVYGKAKAIHPGDKEWGESISLFPNLPGARQIFLVDIELAMTSCGWGVPEMGLIKGRNQLVDWSAKQGEEGLEKYRLEKNQLSIDGKPTRNLAS